jgi:hypothetical protein
VSTHLPVHWVSPTPHGIWHMPFAQARPMSQVCPQLPQFAESDERSRHCVPHVVCPVGHCIVGGGDGAQVPLAPHVIPFGQSDGWWQVTVTVLPQLEAWTVKAASSRKTAKT